MASADEERQSTVEERFSHTAHSMFKALEQTIVVGNGRTLEDLTREMLGPMLKEWLDDNLPTIVERLVRAEIDRVSKSPSHTSSASSEKTE
jgi:uncharacterized protein